MEELKSKEALLLVDERHELISQVIGRRSDLSSLHEAVSEVSMHDGVPEEVRSQFNVARNMALYQHFYYALAPEVQLKTYTIMEYALRLRADNRKARFRDLLRTAVTDGWINDRGFRHLADVGPSNSYCKRLVDILPDLRNSSAHGSNQLTPHCIGHLEKCADFVNQLFPSPIPSDPFKVD